MTFMASPCCGRCQWTAVHLAVFLPILRPHGRFGDVLISSLGRDSEVPIFNFFTIFYFSETEFWVLLISKL